MADQPYQPTKDTKADSNETARDQPGAVGPPAIQDQAAQEGWHPEEQEHRREERRYWRFQYITSSITLLFSFAAAIGAIVGSYIAYQAFIASTQAVVEAKRQAAAAESQVDIADRSMRISNRAYVLSNSGRLISYGNNDRGDRRWNIIPIIENFGNTPTKLLRVYSGVTIGGDVDFANIEHTIHYNIWRDSAKYEWPLIVLGPKAESYLGGGNVDSKQMISMIIHLAITVLGVGKYQDVFGDHHFLEFCFAIQVPQVDYDNFPVGQPIRVPGTMCPTHNCSDEECGPDWEERAK
jgi:hypothetical protein